MTPAGALAPQIETPSPEVAETLLQGLLREVEPVLVETAAARLNASPDGPGAGEGERWTSEMVVGQLSEATLETMAVSSGPSADGDLEEFRGLGSRWAEVGLPLGAVLTAWRTWGSTVQSYLSADCALDSPTLTACSQLAEAWADLGMVATADAHRRAELKLERNGLVSRDEVVRRVLFDGGAPSALVEGAATYGIDTSRTYRAIRARPNAPDARAELLDCLRPRPHAGYRGGLLAEIDGDICGFVANRPDEQLPMGVVGVSDPAPLTILPRAFRQATRILDAAFLAGQNGVFEMADVGVLPAVLRDGEVGESLVDRYVSPLEDLKGGFEVTLDTVESFIENGLRYEPTAQALIVHVNTVRYRVGRFEELTGCSLREGRAVVEAWWALKWMRMMNGDPQVKSDPSKTTKLDLQL